METQTQEGQEKTKAEHPQGKEEEKVEEETETTQEKRPEQDNQYVK